MPLAVIVIQIIIIKCIVINLRLVDSYYINVHVLMSFAVSLLQSFLVLQVYVPASKDLSLDLRYCICICALECVSRHTLLLSTLCSWPGGVMVMVLNLCLKMSRV